MLRAVAADLDEDTNRTIERLAKDFRYPFVLNATIRPPAPPSAVEAASVSLLPLVAVLLPGKLREPAQAGRNHDLEVKSRLGEGGMGVVYVAEQRSLGREVAIKALRDPTDESHVRALIAEGAITGLLEHPNIPPVHQLGVDASGQPLLVMKRIHGVPWGALLRDSDHPGWARLQTSERLVANVEVLMAVARATQFAHSRGIVHRDIKPDNVMIDETGEVYLVDWGIATRVSAGPGEGIVGTPNFLAPEMVMLEELSVRTDVYLLGATLHYVLTGRYRHDGGDLIDVLKSAQRSAPVDYANTLPAELTRLANWATAREPSQRPASAGEFRQALAEFVAHRGSLALARAANERMEELARARAAPEREDLRLLQIGAQARFGFEAALSEWPENPLALDGREACLAALSELELDRENLAGARSLLAELKVARPELSERASALEQRLALRKQSELRLHAMEREADTGIGRRGRRITALGILLATTASSALLLDGHELGYRDLLWSGAVPLAVTIVAGWVFRRSLLANAVGRRVFSLILFASALLFLQRVASAASGSPVPAILRDQLFLLSMAGFGGGLLGLRSWYGASALAALGGLVASLMPARTVHVFAVTIFVGGIVISIESLRAERRPAASPPAGDKPLTR